MNASAVRQTPRGMAAEGLIPMRPDPTMKVCPQCGQAFRVKPSHYDKRVFCSRDCMASDYRNRMQGADNPNYRDAGQHVCVHCGSRFQSYTKERRYCSRACRAASPEWRAQSAVAQSLRWQRAPWVMPAPRPPRERPTAPPVIRTCVACGFAFESRRARKYCSVCGWEQRACVICGSLFRVRRYAVDVTCSRPCSLQWLSQRQRGEQSHLWQGGKTQQTTLIRTSARYAQWRSAVFKRDEFTCQLCQQNGGKLAAHHIRPFATHPELSLESWNGITLCWPCHRKLRSHEADYEAQFYSHTGWQT